MKKRMPNPSNEKENICLANIKKLNSNEVTLTVEMSFNIRMILLKQLFLQNKPELLEKHAIKVCRKTNTFEMKL